MPCRVFSSVELKWRTRREKSRPGALNKRTKENTRYRMKNKRKKNKKTCKKNEKIGVFSRARGMFFNKFV